MAYRAVDNGVINHVSASQIDEFSRCERKWYYNKVVGLPKPPTKSTELGESIHLQIERFYETGTLPEHPSARLLADDPRLPERGEGLMIEYPASRNLGLTAAGITLQGRIDLVNARDPEHPHIWDWKSTSNLIYRKSAADLANANIQLAIYNEWAFRYFPAAKDVTASHAYVLTRGGAGTCIVTTDPLPRDHVAENFAKVESIATRMIEAAKAPTVADTHANYSACDDFGGCPYRAVCSSSTSSTLNQPFGNVFYAANNEDTMSITDKIKQRRAEQSDNSGQSAGSPVTVRASGINPPDAAKPTVIASTATNASTNTEPPAAGTPTATVQLDGTLVLYVDSVPVKGIANYLILEDEIQKRARPIADKAGVMDVREIKFGEGKVALLKTFHQQPLTGVVVARTGGLSSDVLEVLTNQASIVIRGSH